MVHEKNAVLTYWLCPAEPIRGFLRNIISEFGARFDAPVFEPHVTIYVANAEQNDPASFLARVVKDREPYRLSIRDLDYSDKFTKTLFVQFMPDERLASLSEDLRRASDSPTDYKLNPHLSLIYKEMDDETKHRLAGSIRFPFNEAMFDNMKAVISPVEIKSRREVEAWRVIAEGKLIG